MTKFKVGDRIAAYYGGKYSQRVVSIIESIEPNGDLRFNGYWIAHPKQCRRLKPKAPLRRIFLNIDEVNGHIPLGGSFSDAEIPPANNVAEYYVEFVEVRRKK